MTLSAELKPMRPKVVLLKALLSDNDIEAKLGSGISASLDKLPPGDVEQTLHDFQYGPSDIGLNFGEGHRLTLKALFPLGSIEHRDSGMGSTFSQSGSGVPLD